MDLAGVHMARDDAQIRDVLRASARRGPHGEGGVVQASKESIRVCLREGWGGGGEGGGREGRRGLQQRITVGLRTQGGERTSLAHDRSSLSSRATMEETSLVVTCDGRQLSSVGACEGIILAAALLPLAWPAVNQEVFLSSPKQILGWCRPDCLAKPLRGHLLHQ